MHKVFLVLMDLLVSLVPLVLLDPQALLDLSDLPLPLDHLDPVLVLVLLAQLVHKVQPDPLDLLVPPALQALLDPPAPRVFLALQVLLERLG